MKGKVFWTGIEYSYMEDAEEYGKLKGGFVYAFIKAHDVRDALDKIIDKLKIMRLKPIEIEFLKPYEKELEWETEEQTKHYLNLYKQTIKTNDISFDNFHAYKHD
jgi:hypothetical protein